MKVTIFTEEEIDVRTLYVCAGVRYWEDATINGEENEDGSTVPFKDGDMWKPHIDIDKGVILGWPEGTVASIHFKVCDEFRCEVASDSGQTVRKFDGYVPEFMCPTEAGYGDYIIMDVDEHGLIDNWKFEFEQLETK
jgi:hypothetical protein